MSAETQVIEGTVVEDQPESRQEIVRREAPSLSVTPQVQATELVERLEMIRQAQAQAMQEGVDFGVIPGTDKPTLLKPGAEKLGVLFQLDVQPEFVEERDPDGHLTVRCHAVVHHAPTGARLGAGRGVCTTRERKYAYRKAERVCPKCGASAIIKGRQEYGGGWVCFKKKGGCNAKFPDGDQSIESQQTGDIDNPDLPDLWNTVVKMAEKRARVDAVLAVTGASALFTQDAEDLPQARQPESQQQQAPFGPVATDEQEAQARRAIAFLLDVPTSDDGRVYDVLHAIAKDAGGYLPHAVLRGIGHAAKQAKAIRDERMASVDDDPAASAFTEAFEADHGERAA